MYKSIADYLQALRHELGDCDPATVQDALADAEEHFESALESDTPNAGAQINQGKRIQSLIDTFGSPQEVAAAYSELEKRLPLPLAAFPRKKRVSSWGNFFGVAADIRTWSALLYMLFALATGFIYGMWGLVGGALSLFFLIFIIGLPLSGLYLLSIRGLALMEGRIVEALLGVRMPRKPMFFRGGLSWGEKFKALVTESTTWTALFYLVLRLPLGIIYSMVTVVVLAFSLKFALYPLWHLWLQRPLLNFQQPYFPPEGLIPLISLSGVLAFFCTLHLVRWLGKQHGRFAKYLLVRR
jgi:hypothetical protein